MESGGKDRPPMLALGNYVQWKSRIKRYIDTKPNCELIHYNLENEPYKYQYIETSATPGIDGAPQTHASRVMETYATVSEENRKKINDEAEVVHIILIRIDNDIYSIVDDCPNTMEISQAAARNKRKEIANSPSPTYDSKPELVSDEEATLRDKEIEKLMDLISMYEHVAMNLTRHRWWENLLRFGEIELLLITYDTKLDIFDTFLNNDSSGEHSQCNCQVDNVTTLELRLDDLDDLSEEDVCLSQMGIDHLQGFPSQKIINWTQQNFLIEVVNLDFIHYKVGKINGSCHEFIKGSGVGGLGGCLNQSLFGIFEVFGASLLYG
ncbi:hypothetical protein Tco_1029396 [Tanacetum coccineum]|uniref:Integrase, catalytic region, zinc finger, CCHC-type, peptidase aspartic, catalytic n=1 Tax=Tanacetum coccineum TaxID=301880 RepID=A0ABQ5G4Q4_9ASTR